MFKILIHKRAAKIYKELDDKTAAKINNGIPSTGGILRDLEGIWKVNIIKSWDYRIIYGIEEEEKVVIIEDIKRRKRAY